jgi:hypothetical protein
MWHRFPPFGISHTEIIVVVAVLFILYGHWLPRIMRDVFRPPGPRW